MIGEILPEFRDLWLLRNYEKGVENYSNVLLSRQQELLQLAAAGEKAEV